MRKSNVVTVGVLVALGVGAFFVLADPLDLAGDGGVDMLADAFMEDLKFKDFRRASLYHHELDRERIDIGRSLESLFLVKPEQLDIQRYEIVKTEVDSLGTRASTLVRMKATRLNIDNEPQEKDLKLYWMKRHPDCPMGGSCAPHGKCVDEAGEVMHPIEKDDEKKKGHEVPGRASDAEPRNEEVTFSCSPDAEDAWFMNLDSTLKQKVYR